MVSDRRCQLSDAVGVFNLFVHQQTNSFRVINDKFAILTLFYLIDSSRILFSNNFWRIVKCLRITRESIDYRELRRFIFFTGANPRHNTFIGGINIFPPATKFEYEFASDTVSFDTYWQYSRTGQVKNVDEAVEQSYNAIDHNFESMREHFKGRKFIFGNSGGLDSRLIPHFAAKHGLDLSGFTVLRKRNGIGLRTATYISSKRIHKHYGFEQHYFPRIPTSLQSRLTLDVRNAPITSCNMFDNPYEHLSALRDHILIYGNPAYLIGHNTWDISRSHGNTTSWQYFIFYILRMWDLNQVKLRQLSECIDVDDYLSTGEMYRPIFDLFKGTGYIKLFQGVHHAAMDLTAHSGGFESVSRTMFSLPLYFPYLDVASTYWHDDLLRSRLILKQLNRRIDQGLNSIHDQDFNYLGKTSVARAKFVKVQQRLGLLSSGMDLDQVRRGEHFSTFIKEIMCRDNPYYEPLGDARVIADRIINNPSFAPQFSLNFLKVKKMLDIIYFDEYDLLERAEFKIA